MQVAQPGQLREAVAGAHDRVLQPAELLLGRWLVSHGRELPPEAERGRRLPRQPGWRYVPAGRRWPESPDRPGGLGGGSIRPASDPDLEPAPTRLRPIRRS